VSDSGKVCVIRIPNLLILKIKSVTDLIWSINTVTAFKIPPNRGGLCYRLFHVVFMFYDDVNFVKWAERNECACHYFGSKFTQCPVYIYPLYTN